MTNQHRNVWGDASDAARIERDYRNVLWEHYRDHLFPMGYEEKTEEQSWNSVCRTAAIYEEHKGKTDATCKEAGERGAALHLEICEERIKDDARLESLVAHYHATAKAKAVAHAEHELGNATRELRLAQADYDKAFSAYEKCKNADEPEIEQPSL